MSRCVLEGVVYLAVGAGAGDIVSFSAGSGGLRHLDWDPDWFECGGCFGSGVEKLEFWQWDWLERSLGEEMSWCGRDVEGLYRLMYVAS